MIAYLLVYFVTIGGQVRVSLFFPLVWQLSLRLVRHLCELERALVVHVALRHVGGEKACEVHVALNKLRGKIVGCVVRMLCRCSELFQ